MTGRQPLPAPGFPLEGSQHERGVQPLCLHEIWEVAQVLALPVTEL